MIKAKNPKLLNVRYLRKHRGQKEAFEVVYLDDNNVPQLSYEEPIAGIYFVKTKYRTYAYNKPEELLDHMYETRVKISDIPKAIAKEAGAWGNSIVQMAADRNDPKILSQLYRWPYCYRADFQPEYYFMHDWYKNHEHNIPKLTAAFLDIETDILDYMPDNDALDGTAFAPVNLATVILNDNRSAYTFVLEPHEPQGVSQDSHRYQLYLKQKAAHNWLVHHRDAFIKDLNDSFDKTYGHIEYHIRIYKNEIDLIADIFRLINSRRPNFCMSWNMRFDIQYLYYRIIQLGYDPASIMCHPDFKYQRCKFYLDQRNMEFSAQLDVFDCSSYTNYICQMRTYAAIRKSQHKPKSFKLNAISDQVLGDKKVEYPENSNIRTFPYEDWVRFIKYNIKDVLLQFGIESKTKDLVTYYARSHRNETPYNRIFKETHLLRNVRELYFEQAGWVQSNNINIIPSLMADSDRRLFNGESMDDDEDDSASFAGAINAEPSMNDYVGMEVLGRRTNNIVSNATDYDMAAFYPSIKIASNMDPITLQWKAAFVNQEFINGQMVNRSLNQTYFEKDKNNKIRALDITGEAVNCYVSGNIQTFGYNYLNIPAIPTIMNNVYKVLGVR